MVDYLKTHTQDEKPQRASLAKIVDYLFDHNILDTNGKQANWMLRYLEQSPEATDAISATLAKNGLKHFDLVGMGARSIVLEAGHRQIIRITLDKWVSDAAKTTRHPAILQPIKTLYVRSPRLARIDVLPKIDFKGVTHDEEYSVQAVLAAGRLGASDLIGNQNIGVIEVNGKRIPLLADFSELENRGIPLEGIDKTLIRNWLSEDGVSLQKLYDPRIGSGVITPDTASPKEKPLKTTHAERVRSQSPAHQSPFQRP